MKENREEMSRFCNEQEMKFFEERIGFYRERDSEIYLKKQRRKMNIWINRKAGVIERILKPREIPYVNLSKKTLDIHQDPNLKMGPKHILEDSFNLKETMNMF